MRKRIVVLAAALSALIFAGCGTLDRWATDLKSDFQNGLDRVINVYTADGDLLAHYEGKIDIEATGGGYVKFDFNGKRYIYYNCFVETIAEK